MKLLYIIFILSFSFCFCQSPIDIQLPESKFNAVRNNSNNVFQIYISEKGVIYIGYKETELHEVAKELNLNLAILRTNYEQSDGFDVYLYADKRVPYSLVDAVKTEIGMVLNGLLFYKTGDINSRESGFNIFMDPVSFHKLEPINLQLPIEEEEKKQEYLKEQDSIWGHITDPPLPSSLQPHEDIFKSIYSLNEIVINETLALYPIHNCIIIKNDDIIEYKKQNLNNQELLNILHKNDLVFIKASKDLTYNDYIIFKKRLSDTYKELRENNKKSANSLELSEEIQSLLKNTINLCE